jgi:hypothetical protein
MAVPPDLLDRKKGERIHGVTGATFGCCIDHLLSMPSDTLPERPSLTGSHWRDRAIIGL